MKTIQQIYTEYKIPPNLQEHQLRVAAVVSWILDHWSGTPLNKEKIILAALFHDMGNIIKFDLAQTIVLFPNYYKDTEMQYWQTVKDEYIKKYGNEAHTATEQIVEELGNPLEIASLVGGLGFRKMHLFLDKMDFESMIIQYSDMRVSPYCVDSLENRIADFYKRYEQRSDFDALYSEREQAKKAAFEIETIILTNTQNDLIELNEKMIVPLFEKLKNITIEV